MRKIVYIIGAIFCLLAGGYLLSNTDMEQKTLGFVFVVAAVFLIIDLLVKKPKLKKTLDILVLLLSLSLVGFFYVFYK